jgi:non-ribosomal peptide synthetase component F
LGSFNEVLRFKISRQAIQLCKVRTSGKNECTIRKKSSHVTRSIDPTPLKNTSVMIVADGDSLGLLPRGAIGELCFGADQVGRCLPDFEPSATRRFVDHPELMCSSGVYQCFEHRSLLAYWDREYMHEPVRGCCILGEDLCTFTCLPCWPPVLIHKPSPV